MATQTSLRPSSGYWNTLRHREGRWWILEQIYLQSYFYMLQGSNYFHFKSNICQISPQQRYCQRDVEFSIRNGVITALSYYLHSVRPVCIVMGRLKSLKHLWRNKFLKILFWLELWLVGVETIYKNGTE